MQRKGYILVVEPDALIRELIERSLTESGHAVAIKPRQSLAEDPMPDSPHLVIVDIPSPRSAGTLIRSIQSAYAAPILVLSARFRRGLQKSGDAARRLGVRMVLPKPFTRKELLSAVAEAMEDPGSC